MIQILTGEDRYQINQNLKNIIDRFKEKSGNDFNIIKIEAKESGFSKIRQAAISNGFFNKYKLIVVYDFFNLSTDDLDELFKFSQKLSKETVLVLIHYGKPDKRRLKKWQKFQIKELNNLDIRKMQNWVIKKAEDEKAKIENEAADKLSEYIGTDLYRAEQELLKLIAYKNGKIIEESDVEKLVDPIINASIFNLIDNIGAKKANQAMSDLHKLMESGEHELYILTMIVYGFRNLILVKYLANKGFNQSQIASKLKMHPYVVSKTYNQINRFSMPFLVLVYNRLLDAELAIKSGNKNPRLILETLVGTLAR